MAQQTLFKLVNHPSSVSKTTVSIVGTAGRLADAHKMSKELYYQMVDKAEEVITKEFKLELSNVHLVSGGAAWADHVAVTLYLREKVSALTLHLPAQWQSSGSPQYCDTNPGHTSNKLHKQFSEKLGRNTFKDIQSAFQRGAKCRVYKGFKERNTAVASSDYLLAFTWGVEGVPKKGGTRDTWTKSSGKKFHVSLPLLNSTDPGLSSSTDQCTSEEATECVVSAYSSGESLEADCAYMPSSEVNEAGDLHDLQESGLQAYSDPQLREDSFEQCSSPPPPHREATSEVLQYEQCANPPQPHSDSSKRSLYDSPQSHDAGKPCQLKYPSNNGDSVSQTKSRKRSRELEHIDSCIDSDSDIESDGQKQCTKRSSGTKHMKISAFIAQVKLQDSK